MQLCLFSQRWRERRESYRPSGEPINTRLYEIAELRGDRVPRDFILRHHYLGSYPSARYRYGLFTGGELVGVAVLSHPCNDRVLTSVFPLNPLDSVELGRFVLLDSVPANGESWFLARAFEGLRKEGLAGVVSFSDPVPRSAADGTLIHRGHIGTCYQATSATYLGTTTPRTVRLLPDGTVLNDRTVQKIRSGEQGWQYAAAILEKFGAEAPPSGSRSAWLDQWLPRVTAISAFRQPPLRLAASQECSEALARASAVSEVRRTRPEGSTPLRPVIALPHPSVGSAGTTH